MLLSLFGEDPWGLDLRERQNKVLIGEGGRVGLRGGVGWGLS